MARQRMVTRTISITHATVLCMDTVNETATRIVADFAGKFADEKSLLKMAKKTITTDTIIPTRIISATVEEMLYGMPETDFVKYARPIDKTENTTEDTENN